MTALDHVIVAADSAGCVLAHRLSADTQLRVLLLEAGGSDRSPLIRAPGGLLLVTRSGAYSSRYRSGGNINLAVIMIAEKNPDLIPGKAPLPRCDPREDRVS
jgi:hypothetical protein